MKTGKYQAYKLTPPRRKNPKQMKDRIYKYSLQLREKQVITLHGKNPVIRTVTKQDGQIVLYAEVDISGRYEFTQVEILVIGTGHPYPYPREEMSYIGTVLLDAFVWHIFQHHE